MNTSTPNTALRFTYEDLPRLMSMMTGDEKHSNSATSTLDVMWTLYDRVLQVDSQAPEHPERDRFVLSKGHGPMAYYAVLAAKGFIPIETLETFAAYDSPLGMHPDGALVPGVEVASGSLGHGLPIATGMAVAMRARGNRQSRVITLIGDAELDEGSNHEAIVLAARMGLERFITIVVDNQSSWHGWPGGIETRFTVEGWSAKTVDGRDHGAIEQAVVSGVPGRPHCVVAVVEPK